MEYNLFMKFCRDFSIFPEMCTKSILHSIFYNLSSIQFKAECSLSPEIIQRIVLNKAKLHVFNNGEFLDEESYIDAIILCALKSKVFNEDMNPLEKILNFMEKILQSKGIAIVKKTVGKTRMSPDDIDPMLEMRTKYPIYFANEQGLNKKDELLNEVFDEEDNL